MSTTSTQLEAAGGNTAVYSRPTFDALTIAFRESVPEEEQAALAGELLGEAVQGVLGRATEGWQVTRVAGLPAAFDLTPPEALEISVGQGYELQYALAAHGEQLTFASASFETYLDNVPDELPPERSADEPAFEEDVLGMSSAGAEAAVFNWNHNMVRTESAWAFSVAEGRPAQGLGTRIAHPDSGYRLHAELAESHLRLDLQRDVYDSAPFPTSALNRHGGTHGLGTASVLVSSEAKPLPGPFVTGMAPQAEIVPIQIVRVGPPVFLDPFFRAGPRRVRDAVAHAIETGCHVISMSLGGVWEQSLEEIIKVAVNEHNIIVCAAAGQFAGIVVWPARYKEVIAVAGCTASRAVWTPSCRGPQVDVTAPAHGIWRATIDKDGNRIVEQGSGTSYATPHVSGIAALWLAHHGRDFLLDKYIGIPLYQVFRRVLRNSCSSPPTGHLGMFGAGIVDAEATLRADLPERADILAELLEAPFAEDVGELSQAAPFTQLFDVTSADVTRGRLAVILGVPDDELEERVAGMNKEELAFHLVTTPELRAFLAAEAPDEEVDFADAPPALPWHERLMQLNLSDSLRRQISP